VAGKAEDVNIVPVDVDWVSAYGLAGINYEDSAAYGLSDVMQGLSDSHNIRSVIDDNGLCILADCS